MPDAAPPDDAPPLDAFLACLRDALADAGLVRLVLAKPRAAASELRKVSGRSLRLKDRPVVSFVQTHRSRDITTNLPPDAAVDAVRAWLADDFAHGHLFTARGETEWRRSKRGRETLLRSPSSAAAPVAEAHDRAKTRHVDLERPFLVALGVTDAEHRLVPAMARKWKQINKFVEVLDRAVAATGLGAAADGVDVLDFGSGKGYLTFATHDHLRHYARPRAPRHRRRICAATSSTSATPPPSAPARRAFSSNKATSARRAPQRADIMIALHACDTATDHAIHTGVRAGAAVILCSPCCHKELRPQLLSPHPLAPVLRHGVHLGQEAEMLTDGLRAMLLDACGYDAQVFEFVSLEHTSKNKMILAVRRSGAPRSAERVWEQIDALKRFYGIRTQTLETLLRAEAPA